MKKIKKNWPDRRGKSNPHAHLSDEAIRTIRLIHKEGSLSQTELAATFGVRQAQISRVTKRKAWDHID